LIVDDIVIGGKKSKYVANAYNENEDNLNNKNRQEAMNNNINPNNLEKIKNNNKNKKEEITEQGNFGVEEEEEVDLKKKKEKDLKDFEQMLEEQMLLESKRLEEKGIDVNDAFSTRKNINKNTNKSTTASKKSTVTAANKLIPDNTEVENANETQIKKPSLMKSSTSTNIMNTTENSELNNESTLNTNSNNQSANATKTQKQSLTKKPEEKKQSASNKPKESAAAAKDSNKDKTQEKEADEDDDKFAKLNKEEVEKLINNSLGSEAAELLNSDKWNERKEGFAKVLEFVCAKKESGGEEMNYLKNNLDNLLVYIKIKLKGFKENNFNILKEAFSIYIELIKLFAVKKIFERKTCSGILKAYWEKLSEAKVKEPLSNLLFTMMEYFTPNFILSFLTKNLNEKTKSIALLKEYAQFFEKVIDEFGVNQIPIKDLVEFCKNLSANTNPQARSSSTSLLCVLYKYIGKDLKTLLVKDIKEATYKVIEAELDKVQVAAGAGAPAAKRNVVSDDANVIADKSDKKAAVNFSDMLIPRQDISKKLTAKLIKELNEGKWADKKTAAEAIEKILFEANNKILPLGLNDLFLTVFKSKLNDGNKNVVRMMVQLISKLIDALGNNFKALPNGVFKNITPLLIAILADKMLLLREDVLVCMDKWTQNAGIENIIVYVPEQLKIDNFELRTDLFKFLLKHKELIEKSAAAPQILKEFVCAILKCLQDKTQLIRTSAEDFIIFSLRFIGMKEYYAGLKDFKPAIQNDLKKLLDSAQSNYQQALAERENLAKETMHNNISNNSEINENMNIQNQMNNNRSNYFDDVISSSNSNLSAVNRNPNNTNNKELTYLSSNNLINVNISNNNSNLNKTSSKILIENKNNNSLNLNNDSESALQNSNNMNEDSLKQDSKISSSRNYTISNENLSSTSQILVNNNKPNSKKILVTKEQKNTIDRSAEKNGKAKQSDLLNNNNNNNNSKTPETRNANNPYANVTPERQNVSNFAPGDKSKTPIAKTNLQSNKNTIKLKNTNNNNNNLNETNLNTNLNLNTINQEEILFTNNNNTNLNISSINNKNNNSLAGNSQIQNNNSTNLKNESKSLNSGVSPRVIGSKVSSTSVNTNSKKTCGLQCWAIFQPQIQIKLSKDRRFEHDKKNKFNLEAPSDEYVNKLKENLNHIFISEYVQKLLSEDLKQNVEALNLIANYLIDYAQQTNFAFLDYLDIFLKWIFWKVNANQNPSLIKALLELMEILSEIFISLESNFKLNEIEVFIIISCLCEKLGNSSEKVREQAKEILLEKYLKFVFPLQKSASELCSIISNTNKNAKMRLECVEILNSLWRENDQNNILAIKDVKMLVKTFCALKTADAFKNKLQELVFSFLSYNQENSLSYITDLDPKTKETFTQKFNAWIKAQNSLGTNNNFSQNLNTISYSQHSKTSNNTNTNNKDGNNTPSNTTPRVNPSNESINPRLANSNNAILNNSIFKNNNNNTRDFDTINKSDDNIIPSGSGRSVGPTQYTSRKEKAPGKAENLNDISLNLTLNKKKSGLSPLNTNAKNKINNNNNNDDLNNTAKTIKSKNVISKIQNVNINTSMDEQQYYYNNKNNNNYNNNNNKTISNNNLITSGSFLNNNQTTNLNNEYYNNNNTNNALKNKTYSLEDKEDLVGILDNLNNGSDNEKVNTILIIHDIIHAKFDVSKHILIPNIDEVISAFITALKKLFAPAAHNIHEIPVKLGKYLITVLYKISSNKELIKNISYETLFNLSEEVLSNLLIENLDKIGENQEGLVIIRSLNSTMLRVLENCDYTQVIEMLLDVVMKYRHSLEKSKISGLGIKCLLKIHQILEQIIDQIKIDKLLLKVHLIFCDFEQTNGGLESENQTDQMIVRFIKNFVYELVKIKKEEIIVYYNRLVDKHPQKDKYIKKWIRSILSSFESETAMKDKEKERVSSCITVNTERSAAGSNSNINKNNSNMNKGNAIDHGLNLNIGNVSSGNRGDRSNLVNKNYNDNSTIGNLSPNRIGNIGMGNSISPLKKSNLNTNNFIRNRDSVLNDYNVNSNANATERGLSVKNLNFN